MTTQARVEAGVPAGGQFNASQRAEASIALDDLADEYLNAYSDEGTEDERATVLRNIENAYDSARHWGARKGVHERSRGVIDTDDIAQEAMLAVLERQANGHVVHDPKGYMHTYAWGIAQQAGNLAVRQENRKALGMFNERTSALMSELGRPLTRAEEDQVAADIRDNWHDQRRKPSTDFRTYKGQMEVSMDATESPDAVGYLLPNSAMGIPGAETHEVKPGTYADRALAAAEGHDGDLRDAKRIAWNALAEVATDRHVPMVAAGQVSQRRVTAARSIIAGPGGGKSGLPEEAVMSAVAEYEKGTGADPKVVEALFLPWGEQADEPTRAAVASQLRRFPERANELWTSALNLANNRNAARS